MLLILDTSAILSLLLSKKKNYTGDIIKLGHKGELLFGISGKTYKELIGKIATKKVKTSRYYDERKVGQFIVWYKYNAKLYFVKKASLIKTSRDPYDNMFLALAIVSRADYLISIDKDLLTLKSISKTKIITPREFIKRIDVK